MLENLWAKDNGTFLPGGVVVGKGEKEKGQLPAASWG